MLILSTAGSFCRLGRFGSVGGRAVRSCLFSTASPAATSSFQIVPLSSIPKEELGHSILHRKAHGGPKSATDVMSFGIKCAKLCSLGSSALGVFMIPVLSSSLGQGAAEKPSVMAFLVVANAFLGLLTMTPLLLHSLTRRFVVDVYFNERTGVFTSVHYNFLLQKRALRFKAEHVEIAEKAEAAKKLWIPLATVFVDRHPLLLLLDPQQYSDQRAFQLLTAHLPPVEPEKA
ncbi:hypothetical protein M3Y99_01293800 [Aphelenchoides fujianensis]|nr:hypothetical protein M3Y99_01293800 [Aphelenchoides fujianensis]